MYLRVKTSFYNINLTVLPEKVMEPNPGYDRRRGQNPSAVYILSSFPSVDLYKATLYYNTAVRIWLARSRLVFDNQTPNFFLRYFIIYSSAVLSTRFGLCYILRVRIGAADVVYNIISCIWILLVGPSIYIYSISWLEEPAGIHYITQPICFCWVSI